MKSLKYSLISLVLSMITFGFGIGVGIAVHKKEMKFWKIQEDREFIKTEIERLKTDRRFIDRRIESLILTLRLMREKETNRDLRRWIDDLLKEIEGNQ